MTVCVEEPRDEDGRAPASLGMRLSDDLMQHGSTVKPPNKGQLWGRASCPL